MEPMLEKFFEKKRKEFERERDFTLIRLGLVKCVKEYSPAGKKTRRYKEFDPEVNNYYRIKKTLEPIEVTDEEYAEIRKYKKINTFYTPYGLFIVLHLALVFWAISIDHSPKQSTFDFMVVLAPIIIIFIYLFLMAVISLYNYIRNRDEEMKMK